MIITLTRVMIIIIIISITKFSNLIGYQRPHLIRQFNRTVRVMPISNWTVRAITRALKWLLFTASKKIILEFLVVLILKKEPYISQILFYMTYS